MKKETGRQIGLTESEKLRAKENQQETYRLPGIHPVNLNYFGEAQCEKGHAFGPYVRTSYVLHMVCSGRGKLTKKSSVFSLQPGQAFLIYPGEETIYQADWSDPWKYMWVGFHGIRVEEMMARAGFSRENPVMDIGNMDKVQETMNNLLACSDLTYVNELMRMGYLYLLFGELTQNCSHMDRNEKPVTDINKLYVNTAVNMLINSKDPQIRVSDVAKAIGISRGYLTSIFKQEMKVSPQEFQMNFRMEKAGDLLRHTDSSIGAIADELGYSDVMSFSKSFRRYCNMSPSAFRKQKSDVVPVNEKGHINTNNPL